MEMERLSVAEAARRLGISPRAARFRIERGELQAEKENGAWVVIWPLAVVDVEATNGSARQARVGKSRKPFLPREGNRRASVSSSPSVSLSVSSKSGRISLPEDSGAAGDTSSLQVSEGAPQRYAKELGSLAAFRILRGVFERVPDKPECLRHKQCLHGALREVTRGYYQWRRDAKLHCYNEARNWVADAMLELILHPLPDSHLTAKLVRELEHDALSALVGLSRRFERERKGKRGDEGGEG